MKTRFILFILFFGFGINAAFGQLYFGVNTDMQNASATFGYKVTSKIIPYIGIQNMGASIKVANEYEYFDFDGKVTEEIEGSASARVFMPNLGVKYFFLEKENLKSFLNLSFSKPFIGVNVSSSDLTQSELDEINDEIDEMIKSFNLFGIEAGVGAEYFIADQFSIGGEFGLRYLNMSFSNTYEYQDYNPNNGQYETVEDRIDLSGSLRPTYSKLSLNFYF